MDHQTMAQQTELEQIALAMMMMAEHPGPRRKELQKTTKSPQSDPTIVSTTNGSEQSQLNSSGRVTRSSTKNNGNSHQETSPPVDVKEENGGDLIIDEDGIKQEIEEQEQEYCNRTEDPYELGTTANNYSTNPNSLSTPSPTSPAVSLKSNGSGSSSGGGGGANSTRRIFTPQFKQRVLDAFTNDPECVGNQRATARKFNVHRRQVQKWLQQPSESISDQQSSDEQEHQAKRRKEADFQVPPIAKTVPSRSILAARPIIGLKNRVIRSKERMPIVAGKVPLITSSHSSPSPPSNAALKAQKMLELVDELCYLYPSEDFSLLRKAMLNNEVSFTKLPMRKLLDRKDPLSPSSTDYITQQTLQMIKNQNEYLQLLQSGYVSHFQEAVNLSDPNNKYASWLTPFAAAAAAASFNVHGFKTNVNGLDSHRRKSNGDSSARGHQFAIPKAPVSNPKSKTVAAALAASRNNGMNNSLSLVYDKSSRPSSQRRKLTNGRPAMRSYPSPPDDDYFDPTSMLEVITSKPSSTNGGESFGMDLSVGGNGISNSEHTPSSSTIRNKAMNKDYSFLKELGLNPKEDRDINGHGHHHLSHPRSSTSTLEQFVDNVLAHTGHLPTTNNHNDSTNSSESSTKDSVLEAFNFDPELAGDARGVARKFGLNIRVVQKWIREGPVRSFTINGGNMENGIDPEFEEDVNDNVLQQKNVIVANVVNKRKNPKPNQICDFAEDVDETGASDMVNSNLLRKRRHPHSPPSIISTD